MRSDPFNSTVLKDVLERWLKLRDDFPRIYHCCVAQTGPIRIEGQWHFPDSMERSEPESLGRIKTSILCDGNSDAPTNLFPCDLPEILPSKDLTSELRMRLWASIFCEAGKDGVGPRAVIFLTSPKRMVIGRGPGLWFGRSNFGRGWKTDDRHHLELFQIAASDSTALTGQPIRHDGLPVSAFSRWISEVYSILPATSGQIDSEPLEYSIPLQTRLIGQRLSSEGDEQIVPVDPGYRIIAKVPVRRCWLPWDVCTASMKAIGQMLSAGSGIKPDKVVEPTTNTNSAPQVQTTTIPAEMSPSRAFWDAASRNQRAMMRLFLNSPDFRVLRSVLEATDGCFGSETPRSETVTRALNRLNDRLAATANGWFVDWRSNLDLPKAEVWLESPNPPEDSSGQK